MKKAEYYSGTKILSMRDINGNKPEIYMIAENLSRFSARSMFTGEVPSTGTPWR